MANPKRPGRPKIPWDPFDEHLWHRLTNGLACDTVEEEARYLEQWAHQQMLCSSAGKYIQHEQIRRRINKRYNGAAGYRQVRQWQIDLLIAAAKK
jgi:hypothetical protein